MSHKWVSCPTSPLTWCERCEQPGGTDTVDMCWEDLSQSARSWMAEIGEFRATFDVKDREVKGMTYVGGEPCESYFNSNDLRRIADTCIEVARWLDMRAETKS